MSVDEQRWWIRLGRDGRTAPAHAGSASRTSALHFRAEAATRLAPKHRAEHSSARGKVGLPSLVRDQKESQADAVPVRSAAPTPVVEPSRRAAKVSSTIFWALMDKWGIADLEALALLGHAKGLTRKGTRPRFKLTNDEADMVIQLQDVDGALSSLRLDPRRWLGEAIAEAPFNGVMPIAHVVQNKLAGALDLRQHVFRKSLRLSLERNKDGSRV